MTRSESGRRPGRPRRHRLGARLRGVLAAWAAVVLVLPVAAAVAGPRDGKDGDDDRPESSERRDRRDRDDPFKDLSPEERERVRQAFHEAWNDPAVEAARERMREAGEAYKEALREAMSRLDPDVREVMERMMRDRSRRDFHRGGGTRKPPLFRMDEVPEPLRERAEELTEALAEDPEAGRLVGELLRTEDPAERDRRFDAMTAFVREWVEKAEPKLVPFILVPDRERFPWRAPGSNGRRGDDPEDGRSQEEDGPDRSDKPEPAPQS